MHPDLHPSPRTRGFTLVEMLVVVAIIATLIGMLLPAVQSARESSRRVNCGSNLSQLAKACLTHLSLQGHYPTGGWNESWTGTPGVGADWRQPGGWGYTILPYMELQNLYDSMDDKIPVPVFACPSRRGSSIGPLASGVGVKTDYAGNRGSSGLAFGAGSAAVPAPSTYPDPATLDALQPQLVVTGSALNASQAIPGGAVVAGGPTSVPTGGIMFAGSALLPVRVRDGASNTYMVAEKYVPTADYNTSANSCYNHSAYVGDSSDTLRGGHLVPANDRTPWVSNLEGAFGGPHAPGFNAAFCDGSVRMVTFAINPGVHFLLSAREDRQAVQVPD